jgi:hypothetical protein
MKEQVLSHLPDARIVYNFYNKPFVLSNDKLFQSKFGLDIDEAWANALKKINNLPEIMISSGIYNDIGICPKCLFRK